MAAGIARIATKHRSVSQNAAITNLNYCESSKFVDLVQLVQPMDDAGGTRYAMIVGA